MLYFEVCLHNDFNGSILSMHMSGNSSVLLHCLIQNTIHILLIGHTLWKSSHFHSFTYHLSIYTAQLYKLWPDLQKGVFHTDPILYKLGKPQLDYQKTYKVETFASYPFMLVHPADQISSQCCSVNQSNAMNYRSWCVEDPYLITIMVDDLTFFAQREQLTGRDNSFLLFMILVSK